MRAVDCLDEPPAQEPVPVEDRCKAERYAVTCTLRKDHPGTHQHVPDTQGVTLSWT